MMSRTKRGFTVAEAAIALTVITIMAVAAFSTIESSIQSQGKTTASLYARTFISNTLEVFKLAPDQATFDDVVIDNSGTTDVSGDGLLVSTFDSVVVTIVKDADGKDTSQKQYMYVVSRYAAQVTIDYGDSSGPTFHGVILDAANDNEVVFELSYVKGAAPSSAQSNS